VLQAQYRYPDGVQRSRRDESRAVGRFSGGLAVNYGRPVGEFYDYVEQGWGLDGFFRWNMDPSGILSLRLEGGFLSYGRETFRVPLSGTIGGRILVDLTTSNNILWLGFGPQLTLPVPGIRPYVNAAAGFSYFYTESQVEGSDNDDQPFASTKNYDDGTFAWGAGGGFLIPFATRSGEIAIDLGVRYHANGEVRYLREGSIVDLPDGTVQINPIQSEANLVTFRVGISFTGR
jgi:hypothetical protein